MGARKRRVLGGGVCAAFLICGNAQAGVVAFTVDEQQSYFTLAAVFREPNGEAHVVQEPVSGSLRTQFGGTLWAEVGTSPITFAAGDIIALDNGSYEPGNLPANYGFTFDLPPPERTIYGALRNLSLSIIGQPAHLFNGFDMSATDVLINSGDVETDALSTVHLAGVVSSGTAGSGTMFNNGLNRRLQIPLNIAFQAPVPDSNLELHFQLGGMIIATGVIPEPAAGLLLLAGAAALIHRRAGREACRASS